MPSIRRKKDFAAELQSVDGHRVSGCHAYVEIETTVIAGQRRVEWAGRFTSLTDPEHSFGGPYLLKPEGAPAGVEIHVYAGAEDRMGITSDEYEFRGEDAPPELP